MRRIIAENSSLDDGYIDSKFCDLPFTFTQWKCAIFLSPQKFDFLLLCVIFPTEKLRRQDDMIRQALAEKQKLVADILHVPHDQFETFAEMASEPAMDKEAAELILAAVNQGL